MTPQSSPMEDWFERFWHRILKWDAADGLYTLERQYPIGPFFVDFAHTLTRTVIEIDGAYHALSKDQMLHDLRRQYYLAEQGWTVLRFTGKQVYHCAPQCVRAAQAHITARLKELDLA
jgi:very-short-patch-repair endonuclease